MTDPVQGMIPTQLFLQRDAAARVGAPRVVFAQAALGDGAGAFPALSDQGVGLVHEVWRGAVASVTVNADNPTQIDIVVIVPDAAGSFTVREIALYDENGGQVAAGVAHLVKPSSGVDNVAADFQLVCSIAIGSTTSVVLTAPTGGYATQAYVDARVAENAFVPPPAERGVEFDATQRKYRGVLASPAAIGVARQASDAEAAAGVAAAGALTENPFVTPTQLKTVRDLIPAAQDLSIYLPKADLPAADRGVGYDAGLKKYRGVVASKVALGVTREATQIERINGVAAAGSASPYPYLGLDAYSEIDGRLDALEALNPPAWGGVGFVGAVMSLGPTGGVSGAGAALAAGQTIAGAGLGLVTGWGGDGLPTLGAALAGQWRIETALSVIVIAGAEQTGNVFYRSYLARRVG